MNKGITANKTKQKIPLFYRAIGLFVPRHPAKAQRYIKFFSQTIFPTILKKGDIYYTVPKDNVVEINKSLKAENVVLPSKIVHHFIDEASHHAIAKYCFCRTKMDCKNHPKEYGCLLLGEGTVDVSTERIRHVTKEEAHKYAEEARKNGLVHNIGRTYADAAAFSMPKNANAYYEKFMTICNCCSCCCIARAFTYGNQALKSFIKKMPGVEVKISDDCTGCGLCVDSGVCIFRAIKMENGQVRRTEACVACGRCADMCPENAIEIIMDKKSIDDAIEHLTTAVDVK